ncbi:MAG TPA: LLM class flavin-dependent oxidoreductase [Xanthobacteraceae bacterium]|jgi:alkanesulfonate monooxygenase SsuD/methylene tetrahydromethanopterin reductase-like flavin-dependent oxidoreductase (luciferase family)
MSIERDCLGTNPAFSDRKLKLGTFQTNLDSGCVMSGMEGRLDISWPNTLALAKLADEMEFEAIVPVARWRGFGGAHDPQGAGFEAYTWAAGIAASTTTPGVVSTSHVSLNHPIIAAKQCAAIDHISNGRFTLNIVCGWNGLEMEMFDMALARHEDRYARAEEWLGIVRRLWTEDEEFDHDGRFYRIKKGYLKPKPIQKPYPAIMNAGSSERGRHFATKNCDLVYTLLRSHDVDALTAHVSAYHKLAREAYGRVVRVWTLATIVQAETEREAKQFYQYYVHEQGDFAAAGNVVAAMAAEVNERRYTPEQLRAMTEVFVAGWGGYPLIGTKEQIVDGLAAFSRIGLDGVLLSWPRYLDGMREFRDVTFPLVVQAGLRDNVR